MYCLAQTSSHPSRPCKTASYWLSSRHLARITSQLNSYHIKVAVIISDQIMQVYKSTSGKHPLPNSECLCAHFMLIPNLGASWFAGAKTLHKLPSCVWFKIMFRNYYHTTMWLPFQILFTKRDCLENLFLRASFNHLMQTPWEATNRLISLSTNTLSLERPPARSLICKEFGGGESGWEIQHYKFQIQIQIRISNANTNYTSQQIKVWYVKNLLVKFNTTNFE